MLYNIYKTDGFAPLGITDWEHLRVMRLDFSERLIYNHRYFKEDKNVKYLYSPREPDAKLKKIGFISRDFHDSRPNGQLAIRFFSILAKYKQFEVYFYSLHKHAVADKFNTYGVVRRAVDMEKLAKIVVDDSIDILIDMQGFMIDNYRTVLMSKPAPIQMHWLGYPGTLGVTSIDYLVADDIIIPDNSQKYYREKIAYMPKLYQSNNPQFIQREKYVHRGFYDIKESTFVFTHFNSDYKIDRALWFVWMDILRAVPDSLLVFTILTSNENDLFIKQLYADAQLAGVRNKVLYLPKASRHQHFNRLQLFNLGLDTYRINGHTTSADLVCAGVPFITCPSETYHNRVAHSILHELELDELVCENFELYKKKAIELATNKEYYASVKEKVVTNREKVMFNTHLYARNFVNMIYSIWDDYHIRDEERKTVEHIFTNNNELEYRTVPFEKCKLGKFNNNYIGKPETKWVFYENKKLSENNKPYIISSKRKQYLRDFANIEDDCVAFNTEGELFDEVSGDFQPIQNGGLRYGEKQGVWMKEKIPYDEQEPHISVTLNKNYNLPKICLCFVIKKEMPLNKIIPDVVSYLFSQRYINAELIFLSESSQAIPKEGINFLQQNVNFVKFIDVRNSQIPVNSLIKQNTKSNFIIEIKQENLNDKFFVQKIYDESIRNKMLCVGVGENGQSALMNYMISRKIKINCPNDSDGLKHLRSPVNIEYPSKIIYTYGATFDAICSHYSKGWHGLQMDKINIFDKDKDEIKTIDDYLRLVEKTQNDYFGCLDHFMRWHSYDHSKKSCQLCFVDVKNLSKEKLTKFLGCDTSLLEGVEELKNKLEPEHTELKNKYPKAAAMYEEIDSRMKELADKHNSIY